LVDSDPTKGNVFEFDDFFIETEKNEELNINLTDFIILLFGHAPNNNIHGKTRFQKLIYLLNDEFKIFKNLNYFRYYYGPFSRRLENSITSLEIANFIHEDIIYFDDNRLKYRIELKLTEQGIKKFNEIMKNHEGQSEKIKIMFKFLQDNDYFEMNLKELLRIVYQKAEYV